MESKGKLSIKPVKSDVDSSSKSDPHECDDTDLHNSNDTTEEVAAVESGSQCVDVSNDTTLLSGLQNASPEQKNPDPIKDATCSNSPSEAKICGAASDCKNLSPSKTSHDALEVENKPVSDSIPENKTESLSQSPDISLNETSLMSCSIEASCELKTQVSHEGTTLSESHSSAKCVSESKCLSPPDSDVLCKETNQVLDSSFKDNTESLKEYNTESLKEDGIDDSHEKNIADARLVPASSGETFVEKASEEVMENSDISPSSFSGPSESSVLIKADLDNQIACDNGKAPEAAPDAMNCE